MLLTVSDLKTVQGKLQKTLKWMKKTLGIFSGIWSGFPDPVGSLMFFAV